mmetsp:Transcript_18352/g.32354  ORF Transcript_18352/g.32354 Transcript_18352/m.32354 type:complete len:261 (+) Transcript_18352:2518-3300(+)
MMILPDYLSSLLQDHNVDRFNVRIINDNAKSSVTAATVTTNTCDGEDDNEILEVPTSRRKSILEPTNSPAFSFSARSGEDKWAKPSSDSCLCLPQRPERKTSLTQEHFVDDDVISETASSISEALSITSSEEGTGPSRISKAKKPKRKKSKNPNNNNNKSKPKRTGMKKSKSDPSLMASDVHEAAPVAGNASSATITHVEYLPKTTKRTSKLGLWSLEKPIRKSSLVVPEPVETRSMASLVSILSHSLPESLPGSHHGTR